MIASSSPNGPGVIMPLFYASLRDVGRVRADEEADAGTYRYRYVSLATTMTAVNRALAEHALAVSQVAHVDERMVFVTTTLIHESGEWIAFEPIGFDIGRTPQIIGSAISYGRRYALTSLFALVTDDDDGTSASAPAEQQRETFRTASERQIHALFASYQPEWGTEVRSRFRFHFGVGLSALPPDRHDEALAFVRTQFDNIEEAGGLEAP